MDVKAIEKKWGRYKHAAPLLYALHLDCQVDGGDFFQREGALAWLQNFAADKKRTEAYLSTAAAAADLLKKSLVHDVRLKDFKKIDRVKLAEKQFETQELSQIQELREEAKTRGTNKNFRPKLGKTLREKQKSKAGQS